jgi:hypothetical protein
MAGFEVIIYGRFWVIAEGSSTHPLFLSRLRTGRWMHRLAFLDSMV